MDSETNLPNFNLEPTHEDRHETFEYGNSPEKNTELGETSSPERQKSGAPQETEPAKNVANLTTSLPTPIVNAGQPSDNLKTPLNAPLKATDEDKIEKEWVDRAKKIVAETKDDPYKREDQVNELTRDYIEKRYGRKIGVDEDAS